MAINQEQMEADIEYLATTDEEAAELKVDVDRKEYLLKKTEAIVFLECKGNIEERKCMAKKDQRTETANDKLLTAKLDALKIENSRKTAQLRIDVWRSLNANRRQT